MSTKTNTGQDGFTGLRSFLWPIHDYELKKFIPMTLMMMCVLFAYSTLRSTKDALIITECGAETISALKLFFVFPSAIFVTIMYYKMSNFLSKQKLFQSWIMIFIAFFGIFGFILYPIRDSLAPDMSNLIADYPRMKWVLLCLQHWTFSLFYIMSELWGSMVMSLLFWQFANDVTPISQAKRFYPMIGWVANTGLLLSGSLTKVFAKMENPDIAIKWLVVAVMISGVLISIIYSWMQNKVLIHKEHYDPEAMSGGKKKKKEKLSIGESFKYVFTSSYIGLIALLVLTYGVSLNIIEGVWKSQVKIACPDKISYVNFMGNFMAWQGIGALLLMPIGSFVLRSFGWLRAALLTPVMVIITSALFFFLILFSDKFDPIIATAGTTSLMVAVTSGAAQNILSKATKYSLFDPTKEMAYIPLEDELKLKGKAAVDVIGGRLGKSGGAVVQQVLLALIPGSTLLSLTPAISVVCAIMLCAWIAAVICLNKKFQALTKESSENNQ